MRFGINQKERVGRFFGAVLLYTSDEWIDKMKLKIVSKKEEYQQIEKIYNEAFPENERAPMKMLIKRAKQGKADFLAVQASACEQVPSDSQITEETIVGMAYVVCCRDLAYLFYIAIDSEKRGMGYGKQTIAALLERYGDKRFFLALEQLDETAENYAQRVKRHEFYKSCGLRDLPFKIKEGEVIFSAMGGRKSGSNDFTVRPEEYKELMNRYLGLFMRIMVDVRLLE